ncbi:uncharacterized protein LOC100879165 isoform X3 [Megachile rotundata]|uniref:uncharacterized protein LOC100879165 isoform X3 n=1 Tax=Megachile rotundata TaxID=143995 RepID=UPI003FD69C59
MAANRGSETKISTINATKSDQEDAVDIEKAISATGYGTFNVLLLLAALPVAWTGIFDTTTPAFILASAECDLQLTSFRKGVLVAFPFVGMTLTSFVWDHVTPYVGARNLFVLGLLADSVLNVLSSAVDSYHVFLAIKFVNGVFTRLHDSSVAVDDRRVLSAIHQLANLPADLFDRPGDRPRDGQRVAAKPQVPRGHRQTRTGIEAAREDVRDQQEEAGKRVSAVLQNSQLSRQSVFQRSSEKLRISCYNAKLLFSGPYLRAVSFLNFLQFGSMLGFNTMRLWVPHLFVILNNFDADKWRKDRAPTMRDMLDRRNALPVSQYLDCPNFSNICITWKVIAVIYQNSSIIAVSAVLFSFLASAIANSKFRKKLIMVAAFFLSVISSFGMNWAQHPAYMLTLAAAIIVTTRIAGNIVTAVNVDVIPVPLRPSSVAMLTTVGNVAAIVGNFLFSALLDVECLVAFMGLGCLLLACFCLSFFQPKPVRESTSKALEA